MLNPLKSTVVELLQPLDKAWVNRIRSFELPTPSGGRQRGALLTYFDTALELSQAYPADNVIEYALGRLWVQIVKGDDFASSHELIQNIVLQILLSRPSACVECYQVLLALQAKGLSIDLDRLGTVVNTIIGTNAPLGHSSEVAWAIWASMAFHIKILPPAATALAVSSDDVVILLALDLESKKLVDGGLDHSRWEPFMNGDELLREHWLLSYEGNRQGWLPSVSGTDHVAADPIFKALKNANVSFYDDSAQKFKGYSPPPASTGSP